MAGTNLNLDGASKSKVGKNMWKKIIIFGTAATLPILLLLGTVSTVASSMALSMVVNTTVAEIEETNTCQKDDDEEEESSSSSTVTTAVVTNTAQSFADQYGEAAYQTGKKYGLPYEAILGQAAVESAWGKSTLTTEHHNFFGIKATGNQKSVTMATTECDDSGCYSTSSAFASWDSDQEGFDGYGQFIRNNSIYTEALNHRTDPKGYIEALKAASYATDPDYVSTVWGVTEQFIQYIRSSKKWPESNAMEFDAAPPADDNSSSSTNNKDKDEDDDDSTNCEVDDNDNDNDNKGSSSASYGSVGGAPTDTNTFAWMCDSNQKICTASDPGVFYAHLEYGHQCVWYAWNRLAMIWGNEGWTWVMGDGGVIWRNVSDNIAWEVSDDPKPGDGISGSGGDFTNSGYGHVAVVEEVQEDSSGWKIRISEGNFGGTATFDTYHSRWLTKANAGDVHFFRNKSWAKAGS